jgi:hypothetical protein
MAVGQQNNDKSFCQRDWCLSILRQQVATIYADTAPSDAEEDREENLWKSQN